MTHKRWFVTIPLSIIGIVLCAAWILAPKASQINQVATATGVTPTTASTNVATTKAAILTAPVVTRSAGTLQFSVTDAAKLNPIRVEYYIEGKFVAAAFSAPYSVTLTESSLMAGNHAVTAKVINDTGTTDTPAGTFTTTATSTTVPDTTSPTAPIVVQSTSDTPTAPDSGTAAPTNLTGSLSEDQTTIALMWTPSSDAASYQIWRNDILLDTTSTVSYTDATVEADTDYSYYIVTVDPDGSSSENSTAVLISVPSDASRPIPPADTNNAATLDNTSSN